MLFQLIRGLHKLFEACCLHSLCRVVWRTWIARLDVDVPIPTEGLVRTGWIRWRWSIENCPVKIIVCGFTHSAPVSAFIGQFEIAGPVPVVVVVVGGGGVVVVVVGGGDGGGGVVAVVVVVVGGSGGGGGGGVVVVVVVGHLFYRIHTCNTNLIFIK